MITLSTLDTTNTAVHTAVQTALAYNDYQPTHPGTSIVFVGPNGIGKTHMAKALLWADALVDDNGRPVAPAGRFFTANALLQAIIEYQSQNLPADIAITRLIPAGQYGRVVIDDIGHEQNIKHLYSGDQWGEIQRIYLAIFNHCLGQESPARRTSLIVTGSNNCGDVETLAKHLGPAAWDRLAGACPKFPDGRSFIVNLAGVSTYRQVLAGRGE